VVIVPNHSRRSLLLLASRRSYASKAASPDVSTAIPEPPKQNVAILGAGITALSAAYHLLLTPNPPKITIYEKSDRVGGWLQSKYVDLKDGSGSVLFETGPRNIRPVVPTGLATVSLWEDIGLVGNMIITPKSSDAAKKRWLYYPDRLVELPSPARGIFKNLWTLFTEPAFKGYLKDMAYEMSVNPRADSVEDESVGAFISRRVNRNLVDKVASAVLHGIYAGDAWQLSARSVLSDAWWAEKKSGSVFKGMMEMSREGWMKRKHADLLGFLTTAQRPSRETLRAVKDASTVTLDGGLEMFAERLKSVLARVGNVDFKMGVEVRSIHMAKDEQSIEVGSLATVLLMEVSSLILYLAHDILLALPLLFTTTTIRPDHIHHPFKNTILHHNVRKQPLLSNHPSTYTHRNSQRRKPFLHATLPSPHHRLRLPNPPSHAFLAEPRARPRRRLRLGGRPHGTRQIRTSGHE
jgi:protoporphyrinogen oxidase